MSSSITADEFSTATLFENTIEDIWLTTKEAADYLRVSVGFLLNLTSNGRVDIRGITDCLQIHNPSRDTGKLLAFVNDRSL